MTTPQADSSDAPNTGDCVTVELDRKTAWVVRGALMAYRSSVENVLADLRAYDDDARTDLLHRLVDAKLAVERALENSGRSQGDE